MDILREPGVLRGESGSIRVQQGLWGQRLRARRKARGWRQWDVVDRVDGALSQMYVSSIERGEVRVPTPEKMALIAVAYDLDIVEFKRWLGFVVEKGVALEVVDWGRTPLPLGGRNGRVETKGLSMCRVLPEWLEGRDPEQFACVTASDDDLLTSQGIRSGDRVLVWLEATEFQLQDVVLVDDDGYGVLREWTAESRPIGLVVARWSTGDER